jgi:hypothetical protein
MPVKFNVQKMDLARDGKSILIDGLIQAANTKVPGRVSFNTTTKEFKVDPDSILNTIDLRDSMSEFFKNTKDPNQKGFEVHF